MLLDFVTFPDFDLFSLIFPSGPVFLKLPFHKLCISESVLKYTQVLIPQVHLCYLNGLYCIIIRIYFTCLVWKITLISYSKNTPRALFFLSAPLINKAH